MGCADIMAHSLCSIYSIDTGQSECLPPFIPNSLAVVSVDLQCELFSNIPREDFHLPIFDLTINSGQSPIDVSR